MLSRRFVPSCLSIPFIFGKPFVQDIDSGWTFAFLNIGSVWDFTAHQHGYQQRQSTGAIFKLTLLCQLYELYSCPCHRMLVRVTIHPSSSCQDCRLQSDRTLTIAIHAFPPSSDKIRSKAI
ncbi:hypothetical protein L218DRAFT_541258 [Marasmius fiardii PR-910]|nr:hypothetical protein L218DRAFT_541258 [Marasmius fiardii PR-910]